MGQQDNMQVGLSHDTNVEKIGEPGDKDVTLYTLDHSYAHLSIITIISYTVKGTRVSSSACGNLAVCPIYPACLLLAWNARWGEVLHYPSLCQFPLNAPLT